MKRRTYKSQIRDLAIYLSVAAGMLLGIWALVETPRRTPSNVLYSAPALAPSRPPAQQRSRSLRREQHKIRAVWVAVVTERLTTLRGSYSLPPGCRAECRFHYDEYSAVMSCPNIPVSLRFWSGLYEPPLAAAEASVVQVDRLQGLTTYWGRTRTPEPAFCAVVQQSIVATAAVPSYSWCVRSEDARVQEFVRSMLANRFSVPPSDAVASCGLIPEAAVGP
ncbi:MAG: hypothetical protein U0599_18040 [Vicinamibacteria bacterium]